MRYCFGAFILLACVAAIGLSIRQQPDGVNIAESQQHPGPGGIPTETIEGTFRIDRWGQGSFSPGADFVDESVFPKLREHAGIPIRVNEAIAWPEQVPGDTLLTKFDGLERLPQPVSLRLRWMTTENKMIEMPILRTRSPLDLSFEVAVTNTDTVDLNLTSEDFRFFRVVRHPRNSRATYGVSPFARPRGVLRRAAETADLSPQDTKYTLNWMKPTPWQPLEAIRDIQVPLKAGATFSWKVTFSDWEPNEYELVVRYQKHDNAGIGDRRHIYSNSLYLDVLTDEPRQHDVVEMHVRQRDDTELKPEQPVPLEMVFRNRSEKELTFPFYKGTKDDLDLSDMLFCYGNDGRVLPLTSQVAGPMEIRIPVNESFTLPVDAPAGTVVARAVFYNDTFSPKIGPDDPDRFVRGWHWSEHWQHPSVRLQFP